MRYTEEDEVLVGRARELAIALHGKQEYGVGVPYSDHLEAVDVVVCELGQAQNYGLRAAAWLHDSMEDTSASALYLIEAGIPVYVVALVDAVTNGPGKNRRERHEATYERTGMMPEAVMLKLADRIANVRASLRNRPEMVKMYRREHQYFKLQLSHFGSNHAWKVLDNLLGASTAPETP